MTNRRIQSYGLIMAAVVILSGLLLPDSSSGAQEDQIGITVSYAPESGWNPDQTGATSRTVVFMAIGGAAVLLAAFAGFFVFKKTGTKKQKPAEQVFRPADNPVPASPPKAVPRPALQIHSTVPQRPPEAIPPPSAAISSGSVPVLEPSRASVLQKSVVSPEPVPPSASEVRKSAPPASAPAALPDEDDLLFKHLDLLKQLKSKENA